MIVDARDLIGRKVIVSTTDIFGTRQTATIELVELESNRLLIKFSKSILIDKISYSFAVAQPRYEGRSIADLAKGSSLVCAITCVPKNHYTPLAPLDLSWWRGGAAAVADLLLIT